MAKIPSCSAAASPAGWRRRPPWPGRTGAGCWSRSTAAPGARGRRPAGHLKPWENRGQQLIYGENHGKTADLWGKSWENGWFMGKTMGKMVIWDELSKKAVFNHEKIGIEDDWSHDLKMVTWQPTTEKMWKTEPCSFTSDFEWFPPLSLQRTFEMTLEILEMGQFTTAPVEKSYDFAMTMVYVDGIWKTPEIHQPRDGHLPTFSLEKYPIWCPILVKIEGPVTGIPSASSFTSCISGVY